jgi:hypothetical protein
MPGALTNVLLSCGSLAVFWLRHHNSVMRRGSSKEHDFTVTARRVVEQVIGEHLDGTPLENVHMGKNMPTFEMRRLGGKKGGRMRAERLPAEQRRAIARKAAETRWGSGRKD